MAVCLAILIQWIAAMPHMLLEKLRLEVDGSVFSHPNTMDSCNASHAVREAQA